MLAAAAAADARRRLEFAENLRGKGGRAAVGTLSTWSALKTEVRGA